MAKGRIIFLNGTSSAGKTTLAHALQERLPEPWLHVALDQFRDGLPARFRGLNSPVGTTGERGLNVVPVTEGERRHTEIRFGETGERMLRGMRRAIAALVEEGNNVIIDDILLSPAFLDDYLDVFRDITVYFVGVRCPAEEIGRRERIRPGRFPGTAIGHLRICHAHGIYDVEVDTSAYLPNECADEVARFVHTSQPGAFAKLAARRTGQQQMIQQ
ncbi:MAG: AAA family ATPase [Pseudomonadales bacterium]|nr:AAA family ATPase [Pseudomonadales bacterium]